MSQEPVSQEPVSAALPGIWAWAVSAANAWVGDSLHSSESGFAIPLAFYHENRPLPLDALTLAALRPAPTGRLCIFFHGLGCHEGMWRFPLAGTPETKTTYGALLQRDLGFTPLYVRYNSGRAIPHNGHEVAALLSTLIEAYPIPVEEIVLVGHSMGGLVMRYACHLGEHTNAPWVRLVTRLIYLGTPHSGADLERLTHLTGTILNTVPNGVTRLIGRIFDMRSAGIKGLRHGIRPEAEPNGDHAAQWLESARHYFVAGTITADPTHPAAAVLGDGLVRQGSAARAPLPGGPQMETRIVPGVHHLALARSQAVYAHILGWCSTP